MAKSRVKRASRKKPLNIPSFLPGIRGSAKWHVRDVGEGETPHTLNQMGGAGEMAIPLDGSDLSEFIKLHELLHAAHSPVEEPRSILGPDKKFLDKQNLIIAEEMRINLMGRTYVGYDNIPDQDADLLETTMAYGLEFAFNPSSETANAYIDWCLVVWPLLTGRLGRNFKQAEEVRAAFFRQVREKPSAPDFNHYDRVNLIGIIDPILFGIQDLWEDELTALLEDYETPSWESVMLVAAYLQDIKDEIASQMQAQNAPDESGETGEDPDLQDMRQKHQMRDPETGAKPPKQKIPNLGQHLRDRIEDMNDEKNGEFVPHHSDRGDPQWGKMSTRVAHLVRSLPKKLVSKMKYRGTEEGAVPRYIHRLPVDGKIFGRKKKTPGGSVLIDDSGSMSWGTADLEAIMQAAPAVNIAAYSAGYADQGELVILGKDGKYADLELHPSDRPYGGNNLVDLPALEWLSTMPKPRIWVTDTHVTIRGGNYQKALEQVYRICQQKDINIVPDAQAARDVFEGKREIYR